MGVDCGYLQTSKEVVVSNKIKRPASALKIYLSYLIRRCRHFETYPPQHSSNLTPISPWPYWILAFTNLPCNTRRFVVGACCSYSFTTLACSATCTAVMESSNCLAKSTCSKNGNGPCKMLISKGIDLDPQ